MKNIHILPTDKPSTICKINNVLVLSKIGTITNDTKSLIRQNIYITSDEEIKEGDWYICKSSMYPKQCVKKDSKNGYKWVEDYLGSQDQLKFSEKIILTTDEHLIKDGVQKIDDEFLQWFVNNSSCEFVKTEKWLDDEGKVIYSREIPKEENKSKRLHFFDGGGFLIQSILT